MMWLCMHIRISQSSTSDFVHCEPILLFVKLYLSVAKVTRPAAWYGEGSFSLHLPSTGIPSTSSTSSFSFSFFIFFFKLSSGNQVQTPTLGHQAFTNGGTTILGQHFQDYEHTSLTPNHQHPSLWEPDLHLFHIP